jgi:hypothetical protein
MEKRAATAILAGVAVIAVTTGVSAAIGTYQNDASVTSAGNIAERQNPKAPGARAPQHADPAVGGVAPPQDAQNHPKKSTQTKAPARKAPVKKAPVKKAPAKKAPKKKALPSGTATATSFWDPTTASGNPMAFRTLASPYWPLGTKVKITCQGKSAIGVVDDFGPAEWAVAQHDIPAIIDLSEEMMQSLTGSRSNTVHAQFQVLKFGHGPTYRTSGTGFDLAFRTGK